MQDISIKNIAIGVDIEEVSRFKNKTLENDRHFLERIFTKNELEYCFSQGKTAQHLCGKFCAKEAFIKAISEYNISINLNQIEILNTVDGKPYFNLPETYNIFDCKLSISHTKSNAVAFVVISAVKNQEVKE